MIGRFTNAVSSVKELVMQESPLVLLSGADTRLAQLVDRLRPAELGSATPCAGWDVRSMLSHTLQSIEAFSAAVDGGGGPTEAELFAGADILGDDPAGVTKRIVERSHAAWATVDDWDGTVNTVLGPLPSGQAIAIITFSTLVHSWDLAWALGERIEFTAAEATLAEAVGGQLVPSVREQGLFGPEVHPPTQSSATQRVIAFTGRSPL
jgi:uncharacterized protein (TIGR03086 family)